MSRLHRLYRSTFVSFAVVVASLLFVVPASREFMSGNPFMMIMVLSFTSLALAAALSFLWIADKVADRDQVSA